MLRITELNTTVPLRPHWAFSRKLDAGLFTSNKTEFSAANPFSATLVAANSPSSLKAKLLHPSRQRLLRLRPEAVEYPEHFLGVEQPVPLDVLRDHKNSRLRHGLRCRVCRWIADTEFCLRVVHREN